MKPSATLLAMVWLLVGHPSIPGMATARADVVWNNGTMSIDTDAGSITWTGGSVNYTMSVTDLAAPYYDVVNFNFGNSVTFGSGLTVNFTGSRGVNFNVTGNVTVGTSLNVSGANGTTSGSAQLGRIGGFAGGANNVATTQSANGPGAGQLSVNTASVYGGGGGGYGGAGLAGQGWVGSGPVDGAGGAGGSTYGTLNISDLIGGSGGAGTRGGQVAGGGAGGGAIGITASGNILLQSTGDIRANGGVGGAGNTSGGGGSGGSIRLSAGGVLTNNGLLSAIGGNSPTGAVTGGAGGGGRIDLSYLSTGTLGRLATAGGRSSGSLFGADGTIDGIGSYVSSQIVTPFAVQSHNFQTNPSPVKLFDGSGFVGSGDISAMLASPTDPAGFPMAWRVGTTGAFVVLDLGKTYDLANLYFWNGNQTGNAGGSVQSMNVRFSDTTDFTGKTAITASGLKQGGSGANLGADTISLASLDEQRMGVRYVRFDNFTAYGGTSATLVMSEVRFDTFVAPIVVPEPSAIVVAVTGIAIFALSRQRSPSRANRRQHACARKPENDGFRLVDRGEEGRTIW